VDLTVFNFDPCWAAPPSNLCTPDCKAELEKLPQSCLNEFLADLFSSGDDATIDRVEAQLVACGISYDPEAVGAALAPAPAPTPEAAPRA
jgi:hypothetical protein